MMSFRKFKNLRFQTKLFLLFIMISSIPTSLIGITASQKSSQMLQKQYEHDLNVILSQLTTSIERQIKDFDKFSMLPYYQPDTFSFLNKPAISPDNWGLAEINSQKSMLRLMSAYPSIHSSISGLMIYGMNGTTNGYRLSGNLNIDTDINVRNASWFLNALSEKGSFLVTGLQTISQFHGAPFEAIIGSRLLRDENFNPLAVIAIFISPEFIPEMIKSLSMPEIEVIVLDSQDDVIYASHSALAAGLSNTEVSNNKLWEINLDKATYTGVQRYSTYLNWNVYMGMNKEMILAGSKSITNYTIVVVLLVSIAAVVSSWIISISLSQPISRLIKSMRQVEQGKFSSSIQTNRDDEIGRLENSYSRMVNHLEELIQSIEEKEKQKRVAEVYALRARIQPHFLYNTLNSIRMLAIIQKSDQIASLIQNLNKLLRANMMLDKELVSLEEEITLSNHYIALMELRYMDVFEVNWSIPKELLSMSIPPMILQPIIENSIFHGAKSLPYKLNITISAVKNRHGDVTIEITDNGIGLEPGYDIKLHEHIKKDESKHIGLHNTEDRIKLRFGEKYGLKISGQVGETKVLLLLPYITTENRV